MTSEVLFSDTLDKMTCQVPDCDHSSHGGDEMFLHQGCHTGHGVTVRVSSQGVMELRCAECNRFVVNVAVKNKVNSKNTCHAGEPFYVSYIEGTINVHCSECDKVIESVDTYSMQEFRDKIDAEG